MCHSQLDLEAMAGRAKSLTTEKEWNASELERTRGELAAKSADERGARAQAADETARADKLQRSLDDAEAKVQRAKAQADEVGFSS